MGRFEIEEYHAAVWILLVKLFTARSKPSYILILILILIKFGVWLARGICR